MEVLGQGSVDKSVQLHPHTEPEQPGKAYWVEEVDPGPEPCGVLL